MFYRIRCKILCDILRGECFFNCCALLLFWCEWTLEQRNFKVKRTFIIFIKKLQITVSILNHFEMVCKERFDSSLKTMSKTILHMFKIPIVCSVKF